MIRLGRHQLLVILVAVGFLCEVTTGKKHHGQELHKLRTKFQKAPPHIHSKFAYVTWSNDTGYDIKVFIVNGVIYHFN